MLSAELPWLLHVACATVYLVLAVVVIARRPRALLNRLCALLIISFWWWDGLLAFSHYPRIDKASAELAYKVGSFAWGTFASLAVLFIIAFLRPTLLRAKWLWVTLAAPCALVIWAQWTDRIAADYVAVPWGWAFVWQDSWGAWLSHIQYALFMFGGLGALYYASTQPIAPAKRRQAKIISLGAIAPLLLSSLTDVWLPRAGIHAFPNMAPDFVLLWVIALVYAIIRYRMLELTPAAAADRVIETMSDAVFLVDPEGHIAWSNPAATALVGYAARQLRDKTFSELVVDGTSPQDGRRDATVRREHGEPLEVALAITEVRGSVGELVGHVCVATDITPRKRLEAELRRDRDELEGRVALRTSEYQRSEARYRQLIESMHEGVWVLDANDQTTLVNERLADILGYPVADLVGMTPCQLAVETSQAECKATLERARRGEAGPGDWELQRSDGRRVIALVEVSPLASDGAAYAGCVITVMDVTERNRLQQQLVRSDRLASLGLLAAGVGHEINNPLTYVIANLEDIASRAPDGLGDRAREALAGAQRVRDIVKDLRAFSRGGSQELGLVDVHDAIDDAIKLAHHEVRFRAVLVRDFTETAPVQAHRRGMSQVLVNLLVNAAHAITAGSQVEANEIRIETRQVGRTVTIAVVDTGRGIAPEQLARIFDPFHSTKQTGVGLGLAICHEIVASFHGEIAVTSELGKGSRFTISLPASEGAAVRTKRPSTQLPAEPVMHGRVLIIDDEAEVRGAVSRALSKYFEVVAVESATAARALLEHDAVFDLVFCDVMMPGTTGMALAEWAASEQPEVARRIVFMTGGAFLAEAEDFLNKTAQPILEKPFMTADLVSLAREMAVRLGRRTG